jgi:hypothetical protein
MSNRDQSFICGPVEYNEPRQKERFRAIFEYYRSQNQRLGEMFPSQRHQWHEQLVRRTSALLTRASILCKASAFAVEKEWRMGLNESVVGVNGMGFTIRNHRIVPYIEMPLQPLPIIKVYVSPIGDQEIALEGARMLLQAKGYAPSIVHSSSFRLR